MEEKQVHVMKNCVNIDRWFYNTPNDCSSQWWGQWNSGRYKSHCFYAPVESENCYK